MEVGTQERGILIHQHDIRNAGYICTVQNREFTNASVNGVNQQ